MADKKLKLETSLDTTAFDASVKKMQQDLAKISAQAAVPLGQYNTASRLAGSMPGMGPMNGAAKDAYNKATQNSRGQLDQRIREELQSQERITRFIERRANLVRDLQRQQDLTVRGSKEELAIKEKIAKLEENANRWRGTYIRRNSALNDMVGVRQNLNNPGSSASGIVPGGGGPPASGGGGGGSDFDGLLKKIGGATAIATLITKSIDTGLAVYRAYGEAPIRASVSQGNAMNSTFGSELQNIYAGRSAIESGYLPEKTQAELLARQNLANRQGHDTASIYGRITGAGAAGALGGSLFGPMGAAIGGAGGLLAGGASVLMDPRLRARALGEVSPTFRADYESMNAREYADNYQSALDAEKKKNPLKTMALEDYNSNFMRNLDFQRATGLNYGSFHGAGGFRDQMISGGFMDQMGMGMGSAILGANGSTRSATGNALLGLQMQRGMGLTNSGNILGTLSSSLGSAESTRDATIKLMAEGTRLGLDSSQFREENRKFSEVAAEVVARTGTSGGGVDEVLSRFGGFMGDRTGRGIEAGKSAYEAYQQITSATSGATGAMRLGGMMREMPGVSAMDRAALMQMPAEQMTEDNPTIQDIASRNGMSPSDLVAKMGRVNRGGLHRLARADELQNQLSKVVDQNQGKSVDELMSTSPQFKQMFGEYRTLVGVENPNLAKNPREQTSFAEGTLGFNSQYTNKAQAAAQEGRLGNQNTGVTEDRTVQQQAEGSRIMLENFQKLGPTIGQSAESIRKFNDQLQKTVDIISKMPEGERNNLFSKLFPTVFPTNQVQAGKR